MHALSSTPTSPQYTHAHPPWQRPSHSSLYRSTAAVMMSMACPTAWSGPSMTNVRDGLRLWTLGGSVHDLMSHSLCRMISRTEEPDGPACAWVCVHACVRLHVCACVGVCVHARACPCCNRCCTVKAAPEAD